ncbi:MAG: 50S ribosomal protein L29 [Parcubacteria group bacterium]
MKVKETRQKIRENSLEEAKKLLDGKLEMIRKLRFDIASKQVKNIREIRKEKKDVARILTLIKEK